MKHDGYKILCEEVLDNKIPIRPISTLSDETIKGAIETAKDYKAKETEDPDPKKMKSDNKKGTAAGDVKEGKTPGVRDGTGPAGSGKKGKRKLADEKCPFDKKNKK